MAVKIKLMRIGKIREPHYRIVVADARTRRNGTSIETIGQYHPKENPSRIEVDSERAQYWLSVGAQPTEPVQGILKVTGDWQKFKGLTPPAPMKVAPPKKTKQELFEEALAAAGEEPAVEATTAKKKDSKKADDKTADKAESKAEDKASEQAAESADDSAGGGA